MVAKRKFERTNVGQCLDRLNAGCWIVNRCRRGLKPKLDPHEVLATQAFVPYDQLECTVAALQEQLMNGIGLIHDREVKLSGFGERTVIRQNSRKVVKVDCGLTG